ncbi:hypothetical protein, partial [Paenibacillus alginolyticus]|uniref:hypothetical protein n=1 Tax=Paenibacillus alginolyticus TaxID=59839 RepID=UPI002DBFA3B9
MWKRKACIPLIDLLYYSLSLRRSNERTKEIKKKFLQSNRLMWYINQVAFEGRRIKTKEIDL